MRNWYSDCLQACYDQDSVWNIDPGLRNRRMPRPLCMRRLGRATASIPLDEKETTERIAIRQIAKNYERYMK